jgi:hypothetical protein
VNVFYHNDKINQAMGTYSPRNSEYNSEHKKNIQDDPWATDFNSDGSRRMRGSRKEIAWK